MLEMDEKMSKFKEQLKIIEEGILRPMSQQEIADVDKEKLQDKIDNILFRSTKNADGSYDVEGNVNLSFLKLKEFPLKFNKVNGSFYCNNNQLTSLSGCPKYVVNAFYCDNNQLTDLKGGPLIIDGSFNCAFNQLTSLEGCPKAVRYDFNCDNNQLSNLIGCPSRIGYNFDCSFNQLTSLEGCPKEIRQDFVCFHNRIKRFTVKDVKKVCNIYGDVYVS